MANNPKRLLPGEEPGNARGNYLAVHHHSEIDTVLFRILHKLNKKKFGKIPEEVQVSIARDIAEISSIAFNAGVNYAEETIRRFQTER